MTSNPLGHEPPRLLLTAGPTHEPIDAVRYIGNRSSGKLGVALADEAARRGWEVRLLLGPTSLVPTDSRVQTLRFRTTADLEALLAAHVPWCDTLIMAAAVADYRPSVTADMLAGKRRRTADKMVLELEPTPDLLAGCARLRRPGQVFVGFALEPRHELLASARSKLERKKLDMIVGNPLETMDGPTIEALVLMKDGNEKRTPGAISKGEFAPWLLDLAAEAHHARS